MSIFNPGAGKWFRCYKCKVPLWLDEAEERVLRQTGGEFFCRWGHGQVFAAGKTEAEVAREERDEERRRRERLEQENARLAFEANESAEAARKAEAETARLKKRAGAGICPCCNRTFTQLARHMQAKHPEIAPISAARKKRG